MTVVVYTIKNYRLKAIVNLVQEKYVKSLALNKGRKQELAMFYDYDILLYDIASYSTIFKFKCTDVIFLEFNTDNKLMALNYQNELWLADIITKTITNLKISGKATKVQWYPFNNTDYVYSNTDNEISYQNINEKNRRSYVELGNKDKSIVHLAWYNSDENFKYVLVGFKTCELFLCDLDVKNSAIIIQFEKYGNNMGNIVWLRNEPGNFFTVTKGTGKITIWNVSKKSYKEITKYSDCPVVNCIPFSDGKRLLMALDTGTIQIYHIPHQKVQFKISPGHSETVFDLKFSPFIYGAFATCSYDGNIKIWDMATNTVSSTVRVNEPGVTSRVKIYSLKWSPNDQNLLLTGDSSNSIRIWDISKQKQVSSLTLGQITKEVIGIDWNTNDHIIATCGDNAYFIHFEVNKLFLKNTINAKTQMFQCKFSPTKEKQFAVGCFDGSIRFYLTGAATKDDISDIEGKYMGHAHKVFGLAFNPKLPYLASTSDDLKVGIWNTTTSSSDFLIGHTHNVRQIVWITENPKLVISGSWDGTARIWNIDYLICVGLINEHHSDVYGMDISPHHPFLLVTSSRDNSILFWNYLKNPIEYIVNFDNNEKTDLYHNYPQLQTKLISLKNDPISKAEAICNYFFYFDGIKELFDILRVVLKQKEHSDESNRIFYIGDLYSAYKSKVESLEFKYYSQKKFDYNIKRESIIKEAIDLCAKCGDWRKYCELSIVLNEWKQAIMAAPNVSLAYWEELTEKYADYLSKDNDITEESKINAAINSNTIDKAVELILNGEKYEDAKIVWLSKALKDIRLKWASLNNNNQQCDSNNKGFFDEDDNDNNIDVNLDVIGKDDQLSKITYRIAEEKFNNCKPIEAACAFLSIKNINLCLKSLVRTDELEVAYFIMKLTNKYLYENEILLGLIMKQIQSKKIDLALTIADVSSNKDLKILLYLHIANNTKIKERQEKTMNDLIAENDNNQIKKIISKDYTSLFEDLNKMTTRLANDITKETLNDDNLKEIIDFLSLLLAFDFTNIEKKLYNDMYLRLLSTCVVMEMMNGNLFSTHIFLFMINTFLEEEMMQLINEVETTLVSLAYSFYCANNNKKTHKTLNKLSSLKNDKYNIIQALFLKINNNHINKYSCDTMTRFYYFRENTFPINTKKILISSINQKPIKGQAVSKGKIVLSYCQAMEINKYIPQSDKIINILDK